MSKKRIKKLGVAKSITALLLAGTMACAFSSCTGEADLSSLSPSALIEIQDVKDETLMDELLLENQLVYDGELDVVEAADQLERYLDIIDELKDMDFSGVDQLEGLSEELKQEVFSLPIELIADLKQQAAYKGKDVYLLEQKLNALKQLNFLYNTCLTWVHVNGQDVSFRYMLAAVKCNIADELDIPVGKYSEIVIPPAHRSNSTGPEQYSIKVGDQVYTVPVSSDEIWNTINYIYEIQGAKLDGKKEMQTYRKALNFGKTTIAAGSDLKGKNKLVPHYNIKYIRRNYGNK